MTGDDTEETFYLSIPGDEPEEWALAVHLAAARVHFAPWPRKPWLWLAWLVLRRRVNRQRLALGLEPL